jgi:SAM-dependent methyltransferase
MQYRNIAEELQAGFHYGSTSLIQAFNHFVMNCIEGIVHPDTKSKLTAIDDHNCYFEDGERMPIVNCIPILLSKKSIFKADDIGNCKGTPQYDKYSDKKSVKNFIRRKVVPGLSNDFGLEKRYKLLKDSLPADSKVLILGSGDKVNMYKNVFKDSIVITSDVHLLFNPDMVLDAHYIPFKDDFFDLVLASQVLEHTINPWLVSQEIQRVVKENGLIQMEAPQNFPFHAEPYDFFRFTFTGMRSLFEKCSVQKVNITEGNWSVLAITLSNCFVNLSGVRIIRMILLLISGFMFGWLKYLDNYKINKRTLSNPKGYAFTFKKDNTERDADQLLMEYYSISRV